MFGNGILEMNNCNTGCWDFIDSLYTHSYLWGHMAGGGSDTSMAYDVFTSGQCIAHPINSVFMQMYGSYFVEWYKGGINTLHDHLLRAPLASTGTSLATVWSGKAPSWHFHHMALGETIGYSTQVNQNNSVTYDAGSIAQLQGVHMALMGDPSLKMHIVAPVSNLTNTITPTSVDLQWTASPDNNIVGYNVYRSNSIWGTFVKLNSTHIAGTSYSDNSPLAGNNIYMVRAVKLESGYSGSYYNLSNGITDSSFVTMGVPNTQLNEQFYIYPNPVSTQLNFSNVLEGFEIINAVGQVVLSSQQSTGNVMVDGLAEGVYMLRSKNIARRFIVHK
jgi:hypothetical protein